MIKGGPNSVKQTYEAVRKNIPAVVVKGSGRAADVMANAFKATKPRRSDEDVWKNFDLDTSMEIVRHFDLNPENPKRNALPFSKTTVRFFAPFQTRRRSATRWCTCGRSSGSGTC